MRIHSLKKNPWGNQWAMWRSWLMIVVILPVLAACAAVKPPPPIIKIAINATADVNPDARKRASPVMVRLYLLKSTSAFDSSDFFSLFDRDQTILGTDLVQKEELQIHPGEQKLLQFKLPDDTKYIAIMGAFRDLEHAQWRDAKPVSANHLVWKAQLSERKVQLIQTP